MAQNWKFDPVKRDYVLEFGSPVPTDRVQEVAYFILMIPRGNWIYGDGVQGSDLYRFRNAKRGQDTEKLFNARVTEALQTQLIDKGKAISVSVQNTEAARQGTNNNISITTEAAQKTAPLKFSSI